MARLLICLVVFALVSPALAEGNSKSPTRANSGAKQTQETSKGTPKPKSAPFNFKEKEGKFRLEKEKIVD
jgi:hypothetical protein